MSMTPYVKNLRRAIKWLSNKATRLQSMINQKADWYTNYNDTFWSDWQSNVFDIRTANPFGLMIWCIILGVPSSLFGLYPLNRAWGYGPNRQNYIYSGSDPNLPNPNTLGGNFTGGGDSTVLNLDEVRWTLMLRYAALVSNGRTNYINYMLNWIFNGGEPWDYDSGVYFYVIDSTSVGSSLSNAQIFMDNWQGLHLMSPSPRTNRSVSVANYSPYLGTTVAAGPPAPDGVSNSTQVAYAAAATGNLYQLLNNTPGAPTTYWQICQAGSVGHQFVMGNDKMSPPAIVTFDLFAGTIVAEAGGATGTITPIDGWPGWFLCEVHFVEPEGMSGDSMITYPLDRPGTINQFASQAETSPAVTGYIPTTNAPVTVPADYTINASGLVTFASPPPVGAKLYWTGKYGPTNVSEPTQFGTGDGVTVQFQIPKPPGANGGVANAFRLEYHIGPGIEVSSQFINTLNDAQYGLVPVGGGCSYQVFQD